jgi:hypothetical protein
MRIALRVLALGPLAVFGLSLLLDVSLYQQGACPRGFLFKLYLVLVGMLGLPPTLIGSGVAAGFAARHRQWGWLAGLLAASVAGVGFLYGAALDHPPLVVQAPITALSSAFDHTFRLNTCAYPSPYIQAAAVACVLMAAPVVLLSYSFSQAGRIAFAD